jgi:chromate transporter
VGEPLTERSDKVSIGPATSSRSGTWREVLVVFLRLGLTAFGGPAAHSGLFRETLVRRLGWIDDHDFLDLVAATSVIPGPNSSELALAIGRRRAGWPGFFAAGTGFILPAIVISIVLAWLAVGAATAKTVAAVLVGIDPVVIAILVVGVLGLGRSMVDDPPRLAVAALAVAAYLADLPEVGILLAGALLVMAWRLLRGAPPASPSTRRAGGAVPSAGEGPGSGPDDDGRLHPIGALGPLAAGGSLAAAVTSTAIGLVPIFLVFLKAGALLFGSGYVLLALLRSDLVIDLGWISERQLLDAIAVGQATPGPLLSTAGYLGFLLAGVPGALAASIGIFLPAFVLVALLEPIVRAVRARPLAAAALGGAGGAALGLMIGVTFELAAATLTPDGSLAPLPVAVAIVATLALGSGRVGPTVLILAGGLIGLARVFLVG